MRLPFELFVYHNKGILEILEHQLDMKEGHHKYEFKQITTELWLKCIHFPMAIWLHKCGRIPSVVVYEYQLIC